MRTILGFLFIFVLLVILAIAVSGPSITFAPGPHNKDLSETNSTQTTMRISSSFFENNQMIPVKYTCDGDNINPPLSISDVPDDAKTLALIVDDPDAPIGLWVHWIVWNITPDTREIAENFVPKGATEGMTDFGKPGYGGPCPPDSEHRYFFKVFALDTELNLDPKADKEALEEAMVGHVLDRAELVGLYKRKQ